MTEKNLAPGEEQPLTPGPQEPVTIDGVVKVLLAAGVATVWGTGAPPVVGIVISVVAAAISAAITKWVRSNVTPLNNPKDNAGQPLVLSVNSPDRFLKSVKPNDPPYPNDQGGPTN